MQELRPLLVEYTIGNTDKKVLKNKNGKWPLVLVVHDEKTAVVDMRVNYLFNHWLKAAGQSLEYGKNYNGYWTGEMFVKQINVNAINYFFISL